MSDLIEVAPREVHDLVYECGRVLGLDGGIADDVATSVTSIEICFGGGLVAFDREVAALSDQGTSLLASPFVRAPDQWRAAELLLGEADSSRIRFEPATPLAALGAVLLQSLDRGIGCLSLGTGGGSEAPDLTGLDLVEAIELIRAGSSRSMPDRWRRRRAQALRGGLHLPRDSIGRLQRLATTFLVSAAAVDAACGVTGTEGGWRAGAAR